MRALTQRLEYRSVAQAGPLISARGNCDGAPVIEVFVELLQSPALVFPIGELFGFAWIARRFIRHVASIASNGALRPEPSCKFASAFQIATKKIGSFGGR
jgi:hypothetical protein